MIESSKFFLLHTEIQKTAFKSSVKLGEAPVGDSMSHEIPIFEMLSSSMSRSGKIFNASVKPLDFFSEQNIRLNPF